MMGPDKLYRIRGKTYRSLEGSRTQVYRENAYRTPGGLTKQDLFKNKHGNYVSLKKRNQNITKSNLGSLLAKKGSHTFGPNKTRRR